VSPIQQLIKTVMAPLERRILALASRATITLVDDTGVKQLVQITALNGERDQAQRLQAYGFSSNPPLGCSGLRLCIGGSRTHVLFIEGEDGSRKNGLQAGETAQYNSVGSYILLDKDGNCRVHCGTKVLLDAPEAECTGNLTVDGNFTVKGDSTLQQNLIVGENATVEGTLAVTGVDGLSGDSIHTGGNIRSDAEVHDGSRSMQQIVDAYNPHVHGSSPGPSNAIP